MRVLVLAALPVLLSAQGGAPVEGTVISSVTRTGLAGVGVTVEGPSPRHATYTTTTDASGAFGIDFIQQDGEYSVRFQRRGFREQPPRPVHLSAATGAVRLQVELVPHAELRGRVVDAAGHPAPQTRVELLGTGGNNWIISVPVGKDGAFVCQDSLPSSSFEIRAVPLKELPPPDSTENEPRVWAPTYYPDGTDRSQATRIVWRGDTDLEGYDVKLRAVPVYHVRGTVMDEAGKPASGAAVQLLPANPLDGQLQGRVDLEGQTATQADGSFDLSAVRPGDWQVAATWKHGDQTLKAFAAGRVSHGDWEDVRIKLEAPFTVKGVVESPVSGSRLGAVLLMRMDGVKQTSIATAKPDGRFELPDMLPGRYQIETLGPDGSTYLDSVQFGGRDVLGQTMDIMDGSLPIRVVYKTNGGRVQGTAEHCGTVTVVPKDPVLRIGPFIRTFPCESGRFDFGGLRPGDYYAAAFPDRPFLDLAMSPDVMALIVSGGETVRVEAGQSTTVTLKVMSWPE